MGNIRKNIIAFKIWVADQPNIKNIPNGRTRSEAKTSLQRWKDRQAEIENQQIEDYFNNKQR